MESDYIFSNDFYRSIDLMISSSGHERCLPLHSYGPAMRSTYLMHYIHKGKGIFKTGGKTYSLQAGDIFLMIPGVPIYYEADKDDPWEYSWIGLQGIKAEEYLKRTSLMEHPTAHLPNPQTVEAIIENLKDATLKNRNSDLLLNASAYSFVYELASQLPAQTKEEPRSPSEYTQMILSYIEQNFERSLSVQQIADHLSLDRSYVHRLFRKAMNMSVRDYIISLRLANACSYLSHTDLPIADISRSVGYEDVFYFSRLFRQKKGCTPSQYRKEHRKAPALKASAVLSEPEQADEPDAKPSAE